MWISYLLLGFCCEQTVTDDRFVDQCLFAMTIRYNNLMGLLYVRALGLSASLELICNQVSKLIHALKLKCFKKKIVCELKALSMIFLVYENNNISRFLLKREGQKGKLHDHCRQALLSSLCCLCKVKLKPIIKPTAKEAGGYQLADNTLAPMIKRLFYAN